MYIVVNSVGQLSSQEVGLTKQDQKEPSTKLGKEVVLALTRGLQTSSEKSENSQGCTEPTLSGGIHSGVPS